MGFLKQQQGVFELFFLDEHKRRLVELQED